VNFVGLSLTFLKRAGLCESHVKRDKPVKRGKEVDSVGIPLLLGGGVRGWRR
jgi:hypothetical protein